MTDPIKAFLTSLSRSLHFADRGEVIGALRVMEPEFRRDFRPDQFRPGLAATVAEQFRAADSMPTYFELQVALRKEIGAGVSGGEDDEGAMASRYLRIWMDRYTTEVNAERRANMVTTLLNTAPMEARHLARELHPKIFVRVDEEKLDRDWWWARIEGIQALHWKENQLGEAKGMLTVLTRQKAFPRPHMIRALESLIADLEAEGVQPVPVGAQVKTLPITPQAMAHGPLSAYKAAPPPHGPSGETADPPVKKALVAPEVEAARAARAQQMQDHIAAFRRQG